MSIRMLVSKSCDILFATQRLPRFFQTLARQSALPRNSFFDIIAVFPHAGGLSPSILPVPFAGSGLLFQLAIDAATNDFAFRDPRQRRASFDAPLLLRRYEQLLPDHLVHGMSSYTYDMCISWRPARA